MSVQLGNDFRYLASQMLQCEPDVAWPAREEAAAGYVAAASIAYKTYQVQEQLKLQSIFAETNHFADLSEDQEYQRAESAVAELLQFVNDAANQLEVRYPTAYILMGSHSLMIISTMNWLALLWKRFQSWPSTLSSPWKTLPRSNLSELSRS